MNVLFLCGGKALFEERVEGGKGDVGKGRANRCRREHLWGSAGYGRVSSDPVEGGWNLDDCASKVKVRQLNSPCSFKVPYLLWNLALFVCRSARFFVQRNLYIVLKFDASISPLFLQYFFFLFYFLQRVKPTRGRSTFLLHDPFFLSRVHFLSLIPGSSPAYPSIRSDGLSLPFLVPSPSINTHLAINRRLFQKHFPRQFPIYIS